MTISGAMTYNRYRVRRNTTEPGFVFEARNDQVSQTLLIPGLSRLNPNDLFRNGQPGGWADPYDLTRMWIDDAGTTPATIASLGTGIGRVITKGNAITLTQANAADRPVWGRHPVSGIRALQTFTEDFENAAWNKTNSSVVGKFLFDNATTNQHYINNNAGVTATTGQTEVFTVWAKPGTLSWTALLIDGVTAWFDLSNGTLGTVQAGATASIVLEPDGFYRCRITRTRVNALTTARIYVTNGDNVSSYLGDGTGSIELQKSQLELNSGTTYQKVTNRFDITETGQPDLYYFSGNGVNQSWASNATVNFSTTDKVTVWAGLRKLSDAATGIVCELTTHGANNGRFTLQAPVESGVASYRFQVRGTGSIRSAGTGVFAAAPDTSALVGEGNIAAPLVELYRNNSLIESVALDLGGGNFADATLFIGRRAGSSLPYNGLIYNLIMAGGLYDSRTIQRFSDWTLKPRRLITA